MEGGEVNDTIRIALQLVVYRSCSVRNPPVMVCPQRIAGVALSATPQFMGVKNVVDARCQFSILYTKSVFFAVSPI